MKPEMFEELESLRRTVVRAGPAAMNMLEALDQAMDAVREDPFCHWCNTRHAGERRVPDRYCPVPLLAPHHSWTKLSPYSFCGYCGCKLAQQLGGLEEHEPGCPNFPL